MNEFSGLYRKMCGTADEIQGLWPKVWQTWDDYDEKGKYEDGFSKTFNLNMLPEDEREEFAEKNMWLPYHFQLKERVFRTYRADSIKKLLMEEYGEYLKNEELLKELRKYFEGDEILNAATLMFVMERDYKKRWDFKNEKWVAKEGFSG